MPARPDHDAAELEVAATASGPEAPAEDAASGGFAADADAAPAAAETAYPDRVSPGTADIGNPTVGDAAAQDSAAPQDVDAHAEAAPAAAADGELPAEVAEAADEPASDVPIGAGSDDARGNDAPTADADGAALSGAGNDAAPPEAPPDPALFAHALRIAEALVFASDRPVTPARLQSALPPGCDARAVLTALAAACADRPVQLAEVAGGFAFRTAPELAPAITRVVEVPRRLPRAAMETLAIVAYHQPVTRAEIEEIRGASLSQSTLEMLLDASLIAPRGRKEVPGRPSLWGTTPRFLEQFGLKAIGDLPRREELVNEPTLPLSAPPEAPSPPGPDAAEAEAEAPTAAA